MNLGIGLGLTNYLRVPTVALDPDAAISELFRTGTPGVYYEGAWYDPSDSATVFQDAAGTTPAGVGDPVGLILDKSKGLTLGSELAINGTFDTDTGWAKGAGWTISGGVAQKAGGSANSYFSQNQGLTVGGWYKVEMDISGSQGVTDFVQLYDGVAVLASFVGANGHVSAIVQVRADYVMLRGVTPNVTITVDNFSVKELPGNHATQTTSAARPILQQSGATASGFGSELNTTTFPYSYTNYTGYITLGVKSVGRWYRYEFTLSSVTSGGVSIHPERAGLYDSASGTYSHNVYSTATTLRFYANNFTGTVDSVSVREITSWSGGLRYLDFDGVDDVMNVPEIQLGHTSMFALGVKQIGSSGIGWMPIGGGDTNLGADYSSYVWSYTAANSVNIRLTSAAFGLDITSSEAPFEDLDDHVFVVNRTSSSNISANLDGALLGSTTSSSSNNFPVRNFGATYHPSYYEPGRIYGVVIRNALTSAGEITDLETYLAAKSGVTLSGGGDGGDGDKGG